MVQTLQSGGGKMISLFITLKLETPLLITGLGNGEENSSQSLPFIPGSALRGALVSQYASKSTGLRADPLAEQLFFSGKVRFLNAYPLDQSGNRMLPIPASWRVQKGDDLKKAEVADLALTSDQDKNKVIGQPYRGTNTGQGVYVFEPDEELAIHIASQGRGTVKAGESTVFQYQSLARGQSFVALIVADDKNDLDKVEEYLKPNTWLYLGRSRSAGYGKVLIENVKREDKQETESADMPVTTITLLSDTILRDEHGQPTHDLDGYLIRHLNKAIKHESAFIHSTETGGFNRKWKLPLPQMPALGMGSVFVYPREQFTTSEINDLVQTGIGERRVDGFGRIAVNWHDAKTQTLVEADPVVATTKHPLSPASKKLAQTMSERLLRRALDLNLITEANRYSIKGNITNHQLARLRSLLRQAIDGENKEFKVIETFFASLKKTAEDQWQKTRLYQGSGLTGTRLRLWVNERLEKKDGLHFLKLDKETDVPSVAGLRASLTEQLRREYTLRLMEAVIDHVMRAHKEA
jgi:CRISPR-associated protein Csx10